MRTWTPERVKEKMAELFRKAATDEVFRNLCLQEPREAVRQIFGRELPENFRIRFVDNAGYDLTLVLPDLRTSTEGELDEKQLEWVAGGTFDFFSQGTECGFCYW